MLRPDRTSYRIRRTGALVLAVTMAVAGLSLFSACGSDVPGEQWEIRTDMRRQASIRSQESPRPPVPGTMPVTGTNPSLGLERDARLLKNPIEPSAASLKKGKRLFEIYCVPCHGVAGKGDGPVAAKFSQPPDLTTEKHRLLTDGYIHSVIRNGFLTMPPYYETTTATERWHIINYLRTLQPK